MLGQEGRKRKCRRRRDGSLLADVLQKLDAKVDTLCTVILQHGGTLEELRM